ncbi:MAG: hypothetical protein MJH10_21080, partial [Epibacterium sp.]|nr:hypothetical protein [Epibacterium sp.]NQX75950.1 hypothetical protein [Epibacterium sp.]
AKQPEPTDFYVDPAKATSESIESHPVVKGLLEKTEAQERREAERAIKKAHPDIGEILQDEAFFKWIEESPVRTRLLKETDKSFDPEIMGELVTNFKDLRAAAKAREVSADAERNQAAKDASVGNARGAVNQGRKGKKYRASDLRKLQRSDPKTYYARSAEFDLAFQQGRVIMDA